MSLSDKMIQEIDNEVGILYQEALVLVNSFKLKAKELRAVGIFQWYEPTVRADKNSVYISWQHIKIVRKRSATFIAIVKHVTDIPHPKLKNYYYLKYLFFI